MPYKNQEINDQEGTTVRDDATDNNKENMEQLDEVKIIN